MKLEEGLVQVYTGDGKGKTTAALGTALRAVGRGLKVVVVELMKESPEGTGELASAERLAPELTILQFGGNFLEGVTAERFEAVRRRVQEGLAYARDVMARRDADVLVIDEIGAAVGFNVASIDDVFELIDAKPPEMELVLTGRDIPREIIDRADLATEMRLIKHPYQRGVKARKGIEY